MSKATRLGAGFLSIIIGAALTAISITAMRANVPEWELIGALGCAMGLLLFFGGLLFKYSLMAWVVSAVNGALLLLIIRYASWRIVSWERTLHRPEPYWFIASVLLEVFALARVLNIYPKSEEK